MRFNSLLSVAMAAMCVALGCSACSDDNGTADVKNVTTTFSFTAPADVQADEPVVSITSLTLKNVSTGQTSSASVDGAQSGSAASVDVTVAEGLYNVMMEGALSYVKDGDSVSFAVQAYKEAVTITEATAAAVTEVEVYSASTGRGFVIAEIFFTGTETPEGKQYTGDKYFRIYNNSDETLCADGLAIVESEFLTTSKYDYTPDVMASAMAVDAIYRIPLGGNKMVAPGESLLICDIATDHTAANVNSFDLTKADYEWYDESSNPNFLDTDNPDVPNLEKIYCYTLTIWGPHNRGYKTYALARLGTEDAPLTKEAYLGDDNTVSPYYYEYAYNIVAGGNVYPMTSEAYLIPNEWILDAVNLCVESMYAWIVVSPSLDRGWTHCGTVDRDATRYGKSVRRKLLSGITLQDTGNSTDDFLSEQTADPYYKFHE